MNAESNPVWMRKPVLGDVKVVSDGGNHGVLVWTADQQWEPLRGVALVQVLAQPGELVRAQVTLELAFLDLMTPRDRVNLQLVGAELPPREG